MVFDVFVGLGTKTRSAESEKDEIVAADVGNALTAERGNMHDIARADFVRWQLADLNAAAAFEDNIALGCVFQTMPARGDAGSDTRASDGEFGVIGAV